MKIYKAFLILIPFLLIIFAGCGSTPQLTSTPVEHPITIDGQTSDWGTNLKYLSDEKVGLGIANDSNYLYLCMTTNDMGKVIPMFAGGLIVWIQDENSNESTIGIKYPLHNIVNESRASINPEEFHERGRGMMIDRMIKNQDEIRILNKDKFPLTVISTSDSSGLTAKLGYNKDQFVYELRLPLKIDNQNKYGIDANPGDKLLVKFETEKPERGNFGGREGDEGMRPPGGGMGGFPGGGRRGGMRTGGGDRMSFEPIDFSVEVTLK